MQFTDALIILGLGLLLIGPIVFIVMRSLRAESRMTKVRNAILTTGIPVRARLVTLGISPVSAAYPGGTKLLRLTVEPTTPSGGVNFSEVITIDQPIPTIAMGAFYPGAEIAIRISPANRREAAVDLVSMGYPL